MNWNCAMFVTLAAGVATAAPAPTPTPFTANYQMLLGQLRIGETRLQLARDGEDGWKLSSQTHPAGIAALLRSGVLDESSSFRIGNDGPVPLSYSYQDHGSDKDLDVRHDYDWGAGRVRGVARGKPVELVLPHGALDPLLLRLVVGLDLQRDALPAEYSVVDRRKLNVYRLTRLPPSRIVVPAGSYEAVGVERISDDGARTTRFFYAPALGWLPLVMEQAEHDETGLRLELVNFHRP